MNEMIVLPPASQPEGTRRPQSNDGIAPPHPRKLGWFATMALAMGGSNQSLFLLAALIAGQGEIHGQGTAAVPLLIVG